jgi:dethiobiotin synthetase
MTQLSFWQQQTQQASGVFVAGTDTEVGKTYVATRLARALTHLPCRVGVMKPVAAGAIVTAAGRRNEDALQLAAAANVAAPYDWINPYCFEAAISPHLAAADEQTDVSLEHIQACFDKLREQTEFVVVEGAGGWHAPISMHLTMADVALQLRLPVLLVVGLRLGCLNHSMLTRAAIMNSGLPLLGWIANPIDPQFARVQDNIAYLSTLFGAPPLEYSF